MVAQRADWDDQGQLVENEQALRKRFLAKLREYEARYEIKSDRVDFAISVGSLRETAEVCDWLITYKAYRKLGYAL
jgi:hypothetical protein